MVNLFNFKSVENFGSETHTIAFNQFRNYGTLEIATGDTVNWTHSTNHSIVINGTGDATSNAMTRNDFTGGTSITFNEEGTFAYECGIHGVSMTGRIRVRNRQTTRAANGGATTTSRQTTRAADVTTTSRQTGRATTNSGQTTRAADVTTTSRPTPTTSRPVTTTARPAPTTSGPPEPTGLSTPMIAMIVILSIFGVALLLYLINLKYPNNPLSRRIPIRRPAEAAGDAAGNLKYFNY